MTVKSSEFLKDISIASLTEEQKEIYELKKSISL